MCTKQNHFIEVQYRLVHLSSFQWNTLELNNIYSTNTAKTDNNNQIKRQLILTNIINELNWIMTLLSCIELLTAKLNSFHVFYELTYH